MSIVGKDGENAKGHAAVTGHRAYMAGSSEYNTAYLRSGGQR